MTITQSGSNLVIGAAIAACMMSAVGCVSPAATTAATSAKHAYPGVGRTIDVNFGVTTFRLSFVDDRRMSFLGTSGASKGVHDTVEYTARELRSGLYMVYWHEPHTGDNVVHIQDFESGVVHTNVAKPDGQFLHRDGIMKASGGTQHHG